MKKTINININIMIREEDEMYGRLYDFDEIEREYKFSSMDAFDMLTQEQISKIIKIWAEY